MNKPVMLDAGPLGKLAHPRPHPEITTWFKQLLDWREIIPLPLSEEEISDGLSQDPTVESTD
jgi:hypothetical protein